MNLFLAFSNEDRDGTICSCVKLAVIVPKSLIMVGAFSFASANMFSCVRPTISRGEHFLSKDGFAVLHNI